MAITFNTSGHGALTGGNSHTVPFTWTLPAGITTGDVMICVVECFTFTQTSPSVATPTSGGGSWTQIGALQDGGPSSGIDSYATAWWRTATAADPGSTFTTSFTGTVSGTDTFFWSAAVASYTGADTVTPVDVHGETANSASLSVACPAQTTTRAGDWAVYLAAMAPGTPATRGGPASTTQRENFQDADNVCAMIFDSAGSVGPASVGIGGGNFTSTGGGSGGPWWGVWTVGLADASGGGASVQSPAPPRIARPHPYGLYRDLAASRIAWASAGVADLTVGFASSSGGVDTYNVSSPWSGSTQVQMRVLNPPAPDRRYPHAFLIMLPVDVNQTTAFGDSIGTAQAISAHNTWNLTCVQPGYAGAAGAGPWYADNPGDPSVSVEKYTLLVTAWIRKNLATTGNEKVYLIGFSRSGLGGQGLQFRHPDIYAATASWDSPAMMTDFDGTDPTNGSPIGGNPERFYGTSSAFTTKYQLSSANLANWKATGQFAVNRLWIGLGPAFQADIPAYDSLLTSLGIPHTYGFANTGESHAWQTDWVAAALASVIPSDFAQAATVLPQQIPHPALKYLLDVAAVRLYPGITATVSSAGSAALAGAGAVTAVVTGAVTASAAGAGSVTAAVTQTAAATLTGAGAVTAAVTQTATATLAGAGTLTAAGSSGGTTATLAAAGSVTATATQTATATLAGAGALTAVLHLPSTGNVTAATAPGTTLTAATNRTGGPG